MRKLILALVIPLGMIIGCTVTDERAESAKAPAVALSPRDESLEIIELKKMTVEANLQKTCLEILGVFQEAELTAIRLSQQSVRSDTLAAALFGNLNSASETLATKCDPSIRGMYGMYPQLRSIHGRAVYFWKHKRFPFQTKTPPGNPVG